MGVFGARHSARARFYEQLAQMLDAGLTLRASLEALAAGADGLSRAAGRLDGRVAGGATLAEAMAEEPRTFQPIERHVVAAGERAGGLPETARRLASYFELRAEALDRVARGLAYPALLLHAAVLLPPLKLFVEVGTAGYLRAVLPPLAILWAAIGGGFAAWRALRRSAGGRATIDGIIFAIPGIGGIARKVALGDWAHTLGLLYASGLPVVEALERAAEASGSEPVAQAGRRVAADVGRGDRVAEALSRETRVFPRLFIDAVRVGETSGKLDETLARLAKTARDESDRAIRTLAAALPMVIYLGVAAYVAYIIISFYAGYTKFLESL